MQEKREKFLFLPLELWFYFFFLPLNGPKLVMQSSLAGSLLILFFHILIERKKCPGVGTSIIKNKRQSEDAAFGCASP